MAKRNLGEKIKLSTYDEMFGTDTFGHDDQKTEGQIINIPLSELHTFKDHPFRVSMTVIKCKKKAFKFCKFFDAS